MHKPLPYHAKCQDILDQPVIGIKSINVTSKTTTSVDVQENELLGISTLPDVAVYTLKLVSSNANIPTSKIINISMHNAANTTLR